MASESMTSNIIYISHRFEEHGAPHYTIAGNFLRKHGFQIEFENIHSSRPLARLAESLKILARIYLKLARGKACMIYVDSAQHTAILFFLRFLNCPIIYHTQDYLEPGGPINTKIRRFFERSAARRADLVISNEVNRARFMQSEYGFKKKPLVIRTALPSDWPVPEPNPDEITTIRRDLGLPVDRKLVAAGGGFAEGRMSPQVMEAAMLLPSDVSIVFTSLRLPDFSKFPQVENLISEQRFIFLDRRPYADLLTLYSVCDAGLLLYPDHCIGHFYQAPGRLTEYLRSGIPVVCSNFPGFELLCLKYGIGVTCDPYSPTAIAAAISCVLKRDDYPKDSIRQIAKTEFAYENHAENLLLEINNLLGKHFKNEVLISG